MRGIDDRFINDLKDGCLSPFLCKVKTNSDLWNGAVSGKAGISKHYKDITDILSNSEIKEELIQSAINISKNKCALGLSDLAISQNDIKEIEVLFLFANYNSKSKRIQNEVKLVNKSVAAKILFMDESESLIKYNEANDLFCY